MIFRGLPPEKEVGINIDVLFIQYELETCKIKWHSGIEWDGEDEN